MVTKLAHGKSPHKTPAMTKQLCFLSPTTTKAAIVHRGWPDFLWIAAHDLMFRLTSSQPLKTATSSRLAGQHTRVHVSSQCGSPGELDGNLHEATIQCSPSSATHQNVPLLHPKQPSMCTGSFRACHSMRLILRLPFRLIVLILHTSLIEMLILSARHFTRLTRKEGVAPLLPNRHILNSLGVCSCVNFLYHRQ
jgi:hypothetical protein